MSHSSHKRTYLKVWSVLLMLTIVTVVVSYFNFGILNILVAMLVATVKATLVCLFFMHLIEDRRMNQVVFVSSFVFLFVFVALTASDELARDKGLAPVSVAATTATDAGTDFEKLRQSTPELMEKGKSLYAAQCVACHGTVGKGDGPAAAALTPKPRDFTSGVWTRGGTPTQVFKTISEGSPGTAMPPFAGLSAQDRFALAHFVRSLSPNAPADTPETLAALPKGGEKPKQQLPIHLAMQLLAEPQPTQTTTFSRNLIEDATPAAKLYQSHCASCHGAGGEGNISVKRVGVNPQAYLKTKPFQTSGRWYTNRSEFFRIVSAGPNHTAPLSTELTPADWDALYQYVQSLVH